MVKSVCLIDAGECELRIVVGPMGLEDIDEVVEVEKEAFDTSWSAAAYRRELLENRSARYIVLRELGESTEAGQGEKANDADGGQSPSSRSGLQRLAEGIRQLVSGTRSPLRVEPGRIIGFAGMWIILDEAHLTTIAVRREHRGSGFGELLLIKMLEMAKTVGARYMTLEVRVSNAVAQSLYRKYGFQMAGTRRRYYTDNNEDALIMTTGDLTTPENEAAFAMLKSANSSRTRASDP